MNLSGIYQDCGKLCDCADPGLKMWDTFALATVLTLKSDPERPLFKGAAQSV
jgi:hypothetical protein